MDPSQYDDDVLNQLIERARISLLVEMKDLSMDDRAKLAALSPHTFGT